MGASEDERAAVSDELSNRAQGDELVVDVAERIQEENDIELTGETLDLVEAGDVAAQEARRRRRS